MLRDIDVSKRNITKAGYYDWKSLEESIKKHGLLKPLHVVQNQFPTTGLYKIKKQYKYRIHDGNHRMYILRKLYPSDYKIKVKIY